MDLPWDYKQAVWLEMGQWDEELQSAASMHN